MKRTNLQTIDRFFCMAPKKSFLTGIEDTDGAPSSTTFETPADQSGDIQPGSYRPSTSIEGDCLNHFAGPASSSNGSEDNQSDGHGSSVHSGSFLVATSCDIGNFVGKQLDDHAKRHLLEHHWSPPEDYTFPFSVHMKSGREEKRYVNHSHFKKFKWLVLSDNQKGLYCKYCSLFTAGSLGGFRKNVPLQRLVTKPLVSFAKLLGKDGALTVHDNNKYHKEAVEAGKDFLACVRHPENDVANQICSQRLQQVKENRRRLVPIVESIIFLGRQNIAFRGHRDDGALFQRENEGSSASNEGNFRELLRFRVLSGDTALHEHLLSSSSRATYISKTTQNELIKCCGDEILAILMQWVHEAGIYSLMFDETTDLSHTSQLSLVLRYVHKDKVREDFVQFVDPRDDAEGSDSCTAEPALTGKVLGEKVVQMLRNLGLDLEKCVGIATDGCSVMTSELCGAVNEIGQHAPNAVHCPCFNHALNLSLSKSSRVQPVRNAAGTMKEVISFFTASSKRSKVLKDTLGSQLKGLCETRWVERHDSVIQFRQSLPSVCKALDVVAKWRETKTATKAKILRVALSDDEFIVSIVCLSDLLAHTLPLSHLFQKECVDIHEARNALGDTVQVLADRRSHGQEAFAPLYKQAVVLADALDADILPPRVTIRQTYRFNVSTSNPEDYYRQSVYLPLLDNVLEDLKSRLSNEALSVQSLFVFIPSFRRSTAEEDYITEIAGLAERYCSYVGHEATTAKELIGAELRLWKAKWKRESEGGTTVPSTAIGALGMCDEEVYPSVKKFLYLLATLPVSVASAERSFSTLRRLKTWLRSEMGETRLTGLALLNIHRDITINNESVIDRFSSRSSGRRRREFVL